MDDTQAKLEQLDRYMSARRSAPIAGTWSVEGEWAVLRNKNGVEVGHMPAELARHLSDTPDGSDTLRHVTDIFSADFDRLRMEFDAKYRALGIAIAESYYSRKGAQDTPDRLLREFAEGRRRCVGKRARACPT